METESRSKSVLPQFRRALPYLWVHRRPLVVGLLAAFFVGVFYTVSISSIVPLLKIIFSDHESLVDWMHRVETQRRLDVAIAPDLRDDPSGLLIDHVRSDSRSYGILGDGDRIVSIEGAAPGAYGLMRALAQHPEKTIQNVTVQSYDGEQRAVPLKLRRYHWWSNKLRRVAAFLPSEKGPDARLWTLALVMVVLVVAAFLGGMFRLLNEGLVATAVQRAMHDLRTKMADHVLHLPLDWHSAQPPGDTLARFANDLAKIEVGLNTLFGKMVREPIKAAAVLAFLLTIEWRLLAVAVLGLPIGIVAIRILGRAVKKAQRHASQSWGRLLDHLGEKMAGIRVVKAYGMQDEESRRFHSEGLRLTRAQTHIEVVDAATKPVLETLAAVAAAGFVIYGGSRVFSQQLEPALFFAALACLGGIFDPVRKLGNVNNRLQAAEAAAQRAFQLMDQPREEALQREALPVMAKMRESIEFRDLRFRYPRTEKLVVDDVSFTVAKGQVVAIVGPNGSGKTTLVSLLMRFHEPCTGSILIDGQDISQYSRQSLRRQIGLVTQDSVIFSATVRDNIAYGAAADVSEQDVHTAAQHAHVADFIDTLSLQNNGEPVSGYEKPITARTLSGGQRQRLALARAIIRDPAILILDEATSQIDSESEARIQQALDEVTKGRTTFIIAHRFSTIARADTIVVLNDGHVEAHGPHEMLLETCPFYANLFQTQFAYGGS
jgi:ABC-type multidrug transport system fused ATPase/permease subunit